MATSSQRLLSLDVFRGLTIMAMIVANSPNTYGELSHAYWQGVHFADIIFPCFILIVGVAIALGFKLLTPGQVPIAQYRGKILRRTVILFALGMVVNLFYTHFEQVRVLGVLQRIALVYCGCAFLALYCSTRRLCQLGGGILVSYWLLILWVPAPGLPAGQLERGANIINWFDQFMPGMQWRGSWDPEGLLSTYPALVTGIMGVIMGRIITLPLPLAHRVMQLFVFSFVAFSLGALWSLSFPLIKQIWSSSFVLVTGGLGGMCLATLMWWLDLEQNRAYSKIPVIFGANAITAYVLHVVLEKALDVSLAGTSLHGRYEAWSLAVGMNSWSSAALWILLLLLLCFIPVALMYRNRLFIKI